MAEPNLRSASLCDLEMFWDHQGTNPKSSGVVRIRPTDQILWAKLGSSLSLKPTNHL